MTKTKITYFSIWPNKDFTYDPLNDPFNKYFTHDPLNKDPFNIYSYHDPASNYCKRITFGDVFFLAPLAVESLGQF